MLNFFEVKKKEYKKMDEIIKTFSNIKNTLIKLDLLIGDDYGTHLEIKDEIEYLRKLIEDFKEFDEKLNKSNVKHTNNEKSTHAFLEYIKNSSIGTLHNKMININSIHKKSIKNISIDDKDNSLKIELNELLTPINGEVISDISKFLKGASLEEVHDSIIAFNLFTVDNVYMSISEWEKYYSSNHKKTKEAKMEEKRRNGILEQLQNGYRLEFPEDSFFLRKND